MFKNITTLLYLDNTYIHDEYISVWVLSVFYIQKMR